MKKSSLSLFSTAVLMLLASANTFAQDAAKAAEATSMHQTLKQWFIDGGWAFMAPILVVMILGLALCIERVITLNLSSTNISKLIAGVNANLKGGDIEGAKKLCRSTVGPSATVMFEGLTRVHEGPDQVEKAIINYGAIEQSSLEKGLVWISLFIALAPMLGFFGTVIGMVQAFDDIAKAGDIAPDIVASGIKVALLTTVFGLVVAMILQVFYNYFLAKIESLTTGMAESSNALMNMLSDYGLNRGH